MQRILVSHANRQMIIRRADTAYPHVMYEFPYITQADKDFCHKFLQNPKFIIKMPDYRSVA